MNKKTIHTAAIIIIILIVIVLLVKSSSNDRVDAPDQAAQIEAAVKEIVPASHSRDGANFTGLIKYPKHPDARISEQTLAFADQLVVDFGQEVAASDATTNDIFADYKTFTYDKFLNIVFTVERTYADGSKDVSYETLAFNGQMDRHFDDARFRNDDQSRHRNRSHRCGRQSFYRSLVDCCQRRD